MEIEIPNPRIVVRGEEISDAFDAMVNGGPALTCTSEDLMIPVSEISCPRPGQKRG